VPPVTKKKAKIFIHEFTHFIFLPFPQPPGFSFVIAPHGTSSTPRRFHTANPKKQKNFRNFRYYGNGGTRVARPRPGYPEKDTTG
jgi:hypothetical protein